MVGFVGRPGKKMRLESRRSCWNRRHSRRSSLMNDECHMEINVDSKMAGTLRVFVSLSFYDIQKVFVSFGCQKVSYLWASI
jgi:hypothetical protein